MIVNICRGCGYKAKTIAEHFKHTDECQGRYSYTDFLASNPNQETIIQRHYLDYESHLKVKQNNTNKDLR
jgi:hypothetical protein